jgi:phage-related protein
MVLKERIHVLIISAYYTILKATKQWPHNLGSVGEQAKNEFERVKGAAVDMAESAVEAGKDAGQRVQNVGETVVEGVKNAVGSGGESVQSVGSDVGERVQNVSDTVVEGVKKSVNNTEE